MTAKPEPCAYCGRPLGAARLVVTSDATGGPRNGGYHLSPSCYQLAWAALDSTLARQIRAVASGDAGVGSAGAKTANGAGNANLGLLWP